MPNLLGQVHTIEKIVVAPKESCPQWVISPMISPPLSIVRKGTISELCGRAELMLPQRSEIVPLNLSNPTPSTAISFGWVRECAFTFYGMDGPWDPIRGHEPNWGYDSLSATTIFSMVWT